MHSIEIRSLSKKFGNACVLNNISLQIKQNEIFGFLGPNGAGKSTTMMILATLIKPTSGTVIVNGFDTVYESAKVREHIGYVQQEITVDEYLTGRENLLLQARLNHIPNSLIDNRINDVLALIELENKQDDLVTTYSGGMRKRLDIGGSLLHKPQVIFLDEPTVGLDIQTRRKIWEYIKKIRNNLNTSIFLSTHYMEEADELCDRIAIVDHGTIKVIDTPTKLKNNFGNEILRIGIETDVDVKKLTSKINSIEKYVEKINFDNKILTVFSTNCEKIIPIILKSFLDLKIKINSVSMSKPTLDDVFIKYTGQNLNLENSGYNMKKEYRKLKNIRT
ncbi:MAG: ATP-binding cassette domain-containing protein [Nitrosopumilaceae archaeon]|nr:ATP-binding cassette domain-containing protein [Nitrosopumilaceae archaeon]